MKRVRFLATCALVLCFVAGQLLAQTAATSLVFPQIADGVQGDGRYYTSVIYITDLNPSAPSTTGTPTGTCTLSLYGMSTARLVGPTTFNIYNEYPRGTFSNRITTRGVDTLASGYARLDCSQPVYGNLIYTLFNPDQTIVGMAPVFSSPLTTYAMLPMALAPTLQYGIAIANDNDTAIDILIEFRHVELPGGAIVAQILIPPRSQFVDFLDQLHWSYSQSIPSRGSGTLEISSNDGKFSVMGALYSGSAFTTLILPGY